MKLILIIIAFVAFFIALKKWQRAQAVKSGDPDAMANEGLRLIGRNRVDEGIALLEQAANKDHPAAPKCSMSSIPVPSWRWCPTMPTRRCIGRQGLVIGQ